jgi:maltodextrin utilization protein YvdJ
MVMSSSRRIILFVAALLMLPATQYANEEVPTLKQIVDKPDVENIADTVDIKQSKGPADE